MRGVVNGNTWFLIRSINSCTILVVKGNHQHITNCKTVLWVYRLDIAEYYALALSATDCYHKHIYKRLGALKTAVISSICHQEKDLSITKEHSDVNLKNQLYFPKTTTTNHLRSFEAKQFNKVTQLLEGCSKASRDASPQLQSNMQRLQGFLNAMN